MTIRFSNNSILFLIAILSIFSSCTKENSVTITDTEQEVITLIEEEEGMTMLDTDKEVELGFFMSVNGVEVEMDAVAAYCQTDTSEFIIVANKQANLSFPLETQNFEAGDFTHFTSFSDNFTWGYGGQALGEDITGLSGYLSILFSDAKITIESNDGTTIVGSSEGTLIGISPTNEFSEYPYTMSFVAEVVQESAFCE